METQEQKDLEAVKQNGYALEYVKDEKMKQLIKFLILEL